MLFTIFGKLVFFFSPSMFGKVWPTFSGWTLQEIANPTGFREGEEGKELHLLAPTSTIHPTQLLLHLIFRGGGRGEIYFARMENNFSTNEGRLRNFSELLKLPKNVPNYLQRGNLNNSLTVTFGASNFRAQKLHTKATLFVGA